MITFEKLDSKDKVSWQKGGMDGKTIKAFYIDFHTESGLFVMSLYVEGKLVKCTSSSCPPVYNWMEYADTLTRVSEFVKANNLIVFGVTQK